VVREETGDYGSNASTSAQATSATLSNRIEAKVHRDRREELTGMTPMNISRVGRSCRGMSSDSAAPACWGSPSWLPDHTAGTVLESAKPE
jgi:hypothetical protein